MPWHPIVVLVALVALAACSPPPTFGERLTAEGSEVRQLGEQWNRGAEFVERGERLITEGRREIERGERKVSEGRELVERGEQLMRESERRYRTGTVDTAADG
jgi:hypothetical protein